MQYPGNSMSHKMETVEGFRLKCCFFPGEVHTIPQQGRPASCSFLSSSTGTLRGAGGGEIPELFRSEKASEITESSLWPDTTTSTTPEPECHIQPFLKHLQGWRLHHHLGQPISGRAGGAAGLEQDPLLQPRDVSGGILPLWAALGLPTLKGSGAAGPVPKEASKML